MNIITNKTLETLKYDLVREGLVQYETVEQAQEIADAQNINIGQALINSGFITEERLIKFLEEKLHTPYVDLEDYQPDEKCLKYITYSDARRYKIIPLFKIENTLTVAMSDPRNLFAIDRVMETAECEIEPILSSEEAILKKIDEYYKFDTGLSNITTDDNIDYNWQDELHKEDLSDSHIEKILQAIFKQAILEKVHEITFQGEETGLGVLFKKQSALVHKGTVPSVIVASLIAKLKILSDLDPSVSEVPQLGKLCLKVDDLVVHLSVSTFPTIMGERVFLKIYKPPTTIDKIISSKPDLAKITDSLNKPGIILVCGAPLSGKTHIIYSLLLEAAKLKNKNIMTLESITKYELPGVNQCEFNENVGFNMDKATRFIEFQAPDIIYLEGINSKDSFDYFSSLVYSDKTIIMEFLANNMDDLRNKMAFSDFDTLKSIISCLVFIHSKDSVEIFNDETLKRYLG